jgi:predicted molibdopterin-dependent oxidoreductase YjgC
MEYKSDEIIRIRSYYHFVKAVNYYLIDNGLQNDLFVNGVVNGYEAYKKQLMVEDFASLVKSSGCTADAIGQFACQFNDAMNAVLIYSEKDISGATALEIINLAVITGKLGKTATGIVALKENCNSQGLIDNGMRVSFGPGNQSLDDEKFRMQLANQWNVSEIPSPNGCTKVKLENGKIRNLFILGEDPLGCAIDKEMLGNWLAKPEFIVVMDHFMTETGAKAHLLIPANFAAELGGSFTNTQKNVQPFQAVLPSKTAMNSLEFFTALCNGVGIDASSNTDDIFMEFVKLLPGKSCGSMLMQYTGTDDANRMFEFGADTLLKRFEEGFQAAF